MEQNAQLLMLSCNVETSVALRFIVNPIIVPGALWCYYVCSYGVLPVFFGVLLVLRHASPLQPLRQREVDVGRGPDSCQDSSPQGPLHGYRPDRQAIVFL